MKFVRPSFLLAAVLCLLGTFSATAETLTYRVYLGPMYAGKITFDSTVTATDYRIEAKMVDSMPFVTFNDTMSVRGKVTKDGWQPELYEQKLHENDYVAHKQVTFQKSKKGTTARFKNLLDSGEKEMMTHVPKGSVDALTNLWNLRDLNPAAVTKPLDQKVMGLKRTIDQRVEVKGIAKQKIREANRWRVENLRQVTLTVTDEDKPDKNGVWNVYVRPQAGGPLRPVMFATDTKFGAFTAYLQE